MPDPVVVASRSWVPRRLVTISSRLVIDWMPAFYDLTTAATATLAQRRLAGRRTPNTTTEKAVLAGGCFWGMQDMFCRLRGVVSTRVGSSGGDLPDRLASGRAVRP
jgi:hypothetical protein